MKYVPLRWHVLSFRIMPGLDELLAAYLFNRGAIGSAQMDDLLLVYFPEASDIGQLESDLQIFLAKLRAGGMYLPTITIVHQQVEAQDWHSAWKLHFKPFFISERVLVRPSWETANIAPGQVEIIIDPKQAFGTGHHATTRGMLILLEKYLRPGMRVIDVGTGTGILTIAAVKLQPGVRVIALDTDPVAIAAAQENIYLNCVHECVKLCTGTLSALQPRPVDLILANLQYQTLSALLSDFSRRLQAGGILLMSGLFEQEGKSIQLTLEDLGLRCIEIRKEEEWLTLAATVAQGSLRP